MFMQASLAELAIWAVANLARGNPAQIPAFIESGVVPHVIRGLNHEV